MFYFKYWVEHAHIALYVRSVYGACPRSASFCWYKRSIFLIYLPHSYHKQLSKQAIHGTITVFWERNLAHFLGKDDARLK